MQNAHSLEIRNNQNEVVKIIDYIQIWTDSYGKTQIPISYNESLTLNEPKFRYTSILSKTKAISISLENNQHVFDFFVNL